MSCGRCYDPHTGDHPHDYGYDLPDVRATYDVWGPCGTCADKTPRAGEWCHDCYGDRVVSTGTVKVTIVRGYEACPCGSEEGVLSRVRYRGEGPGWSGTVPQSADYEALVRAIWPAAKPPPVDHAWESERALREMGG